jgi:hypothetical protein
LDHLEGFPLSSQQRRIWLQSSRAGRPCLSHATIAVDGELDVGRLKAALQTIVESHEILRTTFRRASGLSWPLQVILASQDLAWADHDLRSLDLERQASECEALFLRAASQPFDLEKGPTNSSSCCRHCARTPGASPI